MLPKFIAGTDKGLVVFTRTSDKWDISSVGFKGYSVTMAYVDTRTHTWWLGITHRHWGQRLHRSSDEGISWQEVEVPTYIDQSYAPGQPAYLERIWVVQHAGADRPGCLWIGTEPGGLFYTSDNGESFQLNESLWNHSGRQNKKQWFGSSHAFPWVHSIIVDPRNSDHVYVGVSRGGVFETLDNGKTWLPKNTGLRADYLPDPFSEYGHDPHRVLISKKNPDVLWQQNHCGVFRSVNGGELWEDVSGDPLPRYGFALVIDEHDPLKAWVIPAVCDEQRVPSDLRLVVCKTVDGGKTWRSISKGLPAVNAFDVVLRHSFIRKDDVMLFGTNNGNVYVSGDEGESWECLSNNLAKVNCVG